MKREYTIEVMKKETTSISDSIWLNKIEEGTCNECKKEALCSIPLYHYYNFDNIVERAAEVPENVLCEWCIEKVKGLKLLKRVKNTTLKEAKELFKKYVFIEKI